MEWVKNLLILSIIILSPALLLLHRLRRSSASNRLPPGPPGWPIFGNIFSLGTLLHRTLATYQQQYGPVVWLKLGSMNAMAILTAKGAAELFKNHDRSFANRTVPDVGHSHGYNTGATTLSDYGTYWRLLRRIGTAEMFANKKMNENSSIRQKCVNNMVEWIKKDIVHKQKLEGIEVKKFVFLTMFNIVGNNILSRDLVDPQSKMAQEFFEALMGITESMGTPNVSDLFPWLRWLDLQGLKKKVDRDMGTALRIASGFVKERMKERREGGWGKKMDLLEMLLDFEGSGKDEPAKLSEHEVNIFILDMLMAGTETISTTIEWAMSELLRNSETIIKIKSELEKIVGPGQKLEESHTDNLPYLDAVVKETLRLHPPAPLLIPRKATQDTNFMGYHIPKDTQVFVNAWAIGRDPACWDNPLCFKPERFLGSNVDYKGNHFELIPFGAGRRICVGMPLAQCMLPLILGSLFHEFDWELEKHVTKATLDMTEKLGITSRKLESLKAIPKRCRV